LNKKKVYFIPIHEGCSLKCSFCSTEYRQNMDNSNNYSFANILSEIKPYMNDVQITGLNICEYPNIISLLKIIANISTVNSIRLNSLNPTYEVSKTLIDYILTEPKMVKEVTIAAQSGCNETLKRMNMNYTISEIESLIHEDIQYKIQVIVGFPGETDEEFNNTYNLYDKLLENKNIRLEVWEYFERRNSPSSFLSNKINPMITLERKKQLLELNAKSKYVIHIDSFYGSKDVDIIINLSDLELDDMLKNYASFERVRNKRTYFEITSKLNYDKFKKVCKIIYERDSLLLPLFLYSIIIHNHFWVNNIFDGITFETAIKEIYKENLKI